MINKELVKLNINDIVPYENNPRYNEMAVDAVKESIMQCNYVSPIVVDENNIILAGHTRFKALLDIGYKEIEVLKVTGLDEQQKTKYRLLDNKTGELAEWDFEKLADELLGMDFQDFDFGFKVNFDTEINFDGVNNKSNKSNESDESNESNEYVTCPHCKQKFKA